MNSESEKETINRINPFIVESPEKLTATELKNLFIEKYTEVESLKERKHFFLWGSRGSGKSMMLRYLEPQCQILVHGSPNNFIDSEKFLAIYCPCKEGQINRTDLMLLGEDAASVISEHILISYIIEQLFNCMSTQFPTSYFSEDNIFTFIDTIRNFYDQSSIISTLEETNKRVDFKKYPLIWIKEFFNIDNRKLSAFLRDSSLSENHVKYLGTTTGYHDFLLPTLISFQKIFKLNIPLYVMLDDANRLSPIQQKIINTWIANRDQSIICFKISAQQNEYSTFKTRSGALIEQPHDYSEINVDELYTNSKSDYEEKVKLIAERRLALSKIQTKKIEKFLPVDPKEYKLYQEIREKTSAEWERFGRPGRQEDYITRYTNARLFQYLDATKKRKNYAGFNNLVHLSSGVVRDFLEPCYSMVDKYISQVKNPETILSIPPALQNKVIFRYSEDFLLYRFDQIKKDLPKEQWSLVNKLATLIESLGRLFYHQLHDPDAREARMFSFTIRGNISDEMEDILNLGIRYRYFQRRTYSTKEGGGRDKWYVLHRRLCPVFKLDPTGFEGRISLTSKLLYVACVNPDQFVQLRLKYSKSIKTNRIKLDPYLHKAVK